ncbi:MAG: polymerase subunit gamma/tau [Patescibacteria group bacterium]|nr:polymerase subunit gamma/tau [Patescibacteria group bacterium]
MSLYQKYRPQNWDSLYGQRFIREALSNALLENRTVGGYLFHGSRGTGKTTVARIFAKAVNCTDLQADGSPCDRCENCRAFLEGRMVDVVEIDAASNNGVDHIRDLIERSRFQPTSGKYKVYIVDEVHMLSRPAFNALLKTLEEPPEHVKFVLATTDVHKVPETIVSRTQRYDFRRISESDIAERLRFVAEQEGIEAEEGAILSIAKLARGGLRDALTLFEQFVLGKKVTKSYVENRLGLVGDDFMHVLEKAVAERDSAKIFELSAETLRRTDPMKFVDDLLSYLRDRIVEVGVRSAEFPLLSDFFESVSAAYARARVSPDPMFVIETTIAKVAFGPVARIPYADVVAPARPAASAPAASKSAPAAVSEKVAPKVQASEAAPVSDGSGKFPGPAISEGEAFGMSRDGEFPESSEPTVAEIPAFSMLDLVAKLKGVPKTTTLVMALKNAPKAAFTNPSTFVIVPKNSLDSGVFARPESKAAIVDFLESLCGRTVSLKIESAN